MVSIWGKKKDNGDRESQQDHEESNAIVRHEPIRREREPDERSRLLPRENHAYLSPDDPAVSIDSFLLLQKTKLTLPNIRSLRIISGASEPYEHCRLHSLP